MQWGQHEPDNHLTSHNTDGSEERCPPPPSLGPLRRRVWMLTAKGPYLDSQVPVKRRDITVQVP